MTLRLPSACSVPPVCVFAAFFVSVDAIFPSVCCLNLPPTLDYKMPRETPNNRVFNLNGKPCVGVKEAFSDWLAGGRGTEEDDVVLWTKEDLKMCVESRLPLVSNTLGYLQVIVFGQSTWYLPGGKRNEKYLIRQRAHISF